MAGTGHTAGSGCRTAVFPNVRDGLCAGGTATACIEPGSPWENGSCESVNAKLRDERLNGEVFHTLKEAGVVIARWRRHCNALRPHASLGDQPPAPEVVVRPAEPSSSAPLAHPTIVTRPTMHQLQTWATGGGRPATPGGDASSPPRGRRGAAHTLAGGEPRSPIQPHISAWKELSGNDRRKMQLSVSVLPRC